MLSTFLYTIIQIFILTQSYIIDLICLTVINSAMQIREKY